MQCFQRQSNLRKLVKFNRCVSNMCNINGRINTVHSKKKVLPVATRLFAERHKEYSLNPQIRHEYSTSVEEELLDLNVFDKVSEETLESLTDYFEELIEGDSNLAAADVSYSGGVLTVSFGSPHGTYVINKQTPNRQIWLSSPTSGPKRYDFIIEGEYWVYKHTGETLHKLLQDEIPTIVRSKVDFARCSHSRF